MQKSHWESKVETYRGIHSQKRRKKRLLINNVVKDILKKYDIKTVLDLGCGLGFYFPIYHECGCHVLAVDYAFNRVEIARKKVEDLKLQNITVKCEDIFQIEEVGHFDCIMLSFILDHMTLPQVKQIISKIKDSARYFIVVGYYSEPFEDLEQRHRQLCRRLGEEFNSFNEKKELTCAVYDYPTLFNMHYSLNQFGDDCSLLLFENVKADSKPSEKWCVTHHDFCLFLMH